MKKIIILLLLSTYVMGSCENNPAKKNKSKKHAHWSYQGETSPEHWMEIEKNSDCDGHRQSPINIITSETVEHTAESSSLLFKYKERIKLKEIVNNGHSIEFDFEKGDSLIYVNKVYHLKQVHFHEPSEHTINGIRYPIELHLVHSNNYGEYLVLSVLGREGGSHKEEEFISAFDEYINLKPGTSKETHKEVDLNKINPGTESYFAYKGSLTTPPCSETVNWIIFKKKLVLSPKTIQLLKENMPLNNYRFSQPLNDRVVYSHKN